MAFGLGPIGARILDLAMRSEGLSVRGAIDVDPGKVGRDVGALSGGPEVGIRVVPSVGALPAGVAGDGVTALHAAGSHLETVAPQLRELVDAGFAVVSTCEELCFPWHRHPEISRQIDDLAKRRGVTVLGTGVNPGFVMDALALCATAVLGGLRTVRVTRAVDVSARRLPLQRKVGVGLSRKEFSQLAASGEIGHVGLEESARLVAHGVGWPVARVVNTIDPTIASKDHRVALGELAAGDVDGLAQTCTATTDDGRRIALALTMRVETEQRDEVVVAGDQEVLLSIPGGVAGDAATAAIAVNYAKRMKSLPPGLLTMIEAGLPRYG